ncbi:MAG TPA: hypothetical protein DDY91_10745 [Planctomycetaceae bacterium]|nr:hypothetical protein [Planctomycetaceae bacterium]
MMPAILRRSRRLRPRRPGKRGRLWRWPAPVSRWISALLALCWIAVPWASPALAQVGGVLRSGRLIARDGTPTAGRLEGLTGDRLQISGDSDQQFELSRVVRFELEGRQARLRRDSPLVILANGDLLVAQVVRADEEQLSLRWEQLNGLREFVVPLEAVRGLVLRQPAEGELQRDLWRRLEKGEPGADELVLDNGDTLRGELKGMTEREVRLEGENAPGQVSRKGVVAVLFNPELQDLPALEGPGALVSLIDGSRFHARGLELINSEVLQCQAVCGTLLEIPCAAVTSLQFLGHGIRPLSEIEPAEADFTPYLEDRWPWRRDRNCLGQPLQLRGNSHATGLGVHSRQHLDYDLAGMAEGFLATVGVDDSARGRGAVEFVVLVDDQPAWKSGVVRGRDEPRAVPFVSLAGARRLTLLVEFGPEANVLDHADWCDAVLIEKLR